MLNTWEIDFIAEVKARTLAKQPVSQHEKQIILDLLKREGKAVRPEVVQQAAAQGFNVEGIKTL